MGEQKFSKKPEIMYSINDNPLDAITRKIIRLEADLRETEIELAEARYAYADGIMENKTAKDLGYAPDDLSGLEKKIKKLETSVTLIESILKDYEAQMKALKNGDKNLEKNFKGIPGDKNRPSA